MGEPPSETGAFHETVTRSAATEVARTEVGGPGTGPADPAGTEPSAAANTGMANTAISLIRLTVAPWPDSRVPPMLSPSRNKPEPTLSGNTTLGRIRRRPPNHWVSVLACGATVGESMSGGPQSKQISRAGRRVHVLPSDVCQPRAS
jgi:hypothetical protein